MHTVQLRFACLMLPALLAATPIHHPTDTPFPVAASNTDAAFALYRQIAGDAEGNVFFSPFSISTALAMTYAGADGRTAEEMAGALHYGPNGTAFHQAYGDYLGQLLDQAEGHIDLRIANRLWGDTRYEFDPGFLDLNASAYRSPLALADFQHQPEPSRVRINNWVADQTEQRIQDLIPQGSVSESTRLILTNAVYFKGDWARAFDPDRTADRKFHPTAGAPVLVPFMNSRSSLAFSENDRYKMVRLPYQGDAQSMIIVLPHRDQDLPEVEATFDAAALRTAFHMPQADEVVLSLPKFKMTLPLSLRDHLEAMGMTEAFTPRANFSRMSPDNDLRISDVIHKAFVEIDEVGTEAAAATAVVMEHLSSAMPQQRPTKLFIADHPFLFYIVDDRTQSILFMGRMAQPKS